MEKQVDIRPGIALVQDSRFFPLGEDTVLLSAFAAPKKGALGLDLGAGQGFLAILCGLRRPDLHLEGLELQPEACALAQANARRAGLELPVTAGDLRQLPGALHGRYDFVLCNPPYYEQARGRTAQDGALAQARCDLGAGIGQVCRAAFLTLKTGGRLYLCFPAGRLPDLCAALEQNRLAPKRLRLVHAGPGKAAHLVLMDAVKQGGPGLTVLPPLFVREENGAPSREYREIYGGIV